MTDPLIYIDSVLADTRGNQNVYVPVMARHLQDLRNELVYRRDQMTTFGEMFNPNRRFPHKPPNWITTNAPQSPVPNSYIYFIVEEGDGRFVKIGRSKNIGWRPPELQVGNPRLLKVMRQIPGGQQLENWMKRRFAQHKVRGEWFLTREEMATIEPPSHL